MTTPTRARVEVSQYHGLRMSVEEYLALPEEKPYLEYVDGIALQKPMPNMEHGQIVAELTIELGMYARAHGGRLGPEVRAAFERSETYRLPDLSYWAPGRTASDDSIPSLAVEVRSPDQSLQELRNKCRFYRTNGVDACWLIDPRLRIVEVFEGDDDGRRLDREGALESAFLPGFSFPLTDLWAVLER